MNRNSGTYANSWRKLSKITAFLGAIFLAVLPAQPAVTAELPQLHSLRGEMYRVLQGAPFGKGEAVKAIKSYIWARDDRMRTETRIGNRIAISIQVGNVIYSYEKGSKVGQVDTLVQESLGSTGIIGQIRRLKKEGLKNEVITDKQTGERFQKFTFKNLPHEMAIVLLSAVTSLPRIWYSTVRVSEKKAEMLKIIYRNMEANIEIPEGYFQPPEGINWRQQR